MPEDNMLPPSQHHLYRSRPVVRNDNVPDQDISSEYNDTYSVKSGLLQPTHFQKHLFADNRSHEQKMQKFVTNKVTHNNNDNNTKNRHTLNPHDNSSLTACADPLNHNITYIPNNAISSKSNTLKRLYEEYKHEHEHQQQSQPVNSRQSNAMYHQQFPRHHLASTEKGRLNLQTSQLQQSQHANPFAQNESDEHNENVKKMRTQINHPLKEASDFRAMTQQRMMMPKQSQSAQAEADVVMTERAAVEYEELDNPHDLPGYRKISKIGEGTYGIVFKAEHKATKELVALKKIRLNMQEGIPTTTLREIAVLKELKHENIVRMTDMIQKSTAVYLVCDYSEVDLRKYMERAGRNGLTIDHIRSFMHQLLRGLHYCHTRRILHRDLKPQNLLIDRFGRLTIADLGLARSFGVPMRAYTHQVVTLWYRAPEILLGSDYYSTAVDMWSVGCIMAELIAFKPLFPGSTQIEELFHIFQIRGTPTEEIWPGVSTLRDYNSQFPPWKPKELKSLLLRSSDSIEVPDLAFDLLERLLTYDPSNRITARSAEEHDFFYFDISKLQF